MPHSKIGALLTILFIVSTSVSLVSALRCYQCVYGYQYLCADIDMSPVTCLANQTKCGLGVVLHNNRRFTWRGCVDPFQNSAIMDNLTMFGSKIIDPSSDVSAAEFSSCFFDLCNQPKRCYTCTAGLDSVCAPKDVGARECLVNQAFCAKLDIDSNLVWKGCISQTQLNYLMEYPVGRSLGNALNIMTGTNVTKALSLNVCQGSLCNRAGKMSTSLLTTITAMVFFITNR